MPQAMKFKPKARAADAAAADVRRSETVPQKPAPMQAGAVLRSFNPTTFEEVVRLAKMAVKAGLPASRDDDEERAIAKATMAIMQGLEVGIPAMQAVQNIAIINGKAMIYGDLLTAVLWSKGFKIKKWVDGVGDARVGHARITRPDGDVIEKSFSVAQAKKARLWDTREKVRRKGRNGEWYEAENDGPWFRFDERMLEWRAFGFCCKDGASDATRGMLVYEEASPEANRMVDVTPVASHPLADERMIEHEAEPQTPQGFDVDGFLATLDAALAKATTQGDLIKAWGAHERTVEGELPSDQRQRAFDLYTTHETRIAKA